MKKIVLLIIVACACTAVSARKFCEEGKKWRTIVYHMIENPLGDRFYEMRGDTIIGGTACKKFYEKSDATRHRFAYAAAFYEDERGDVFAFFPGKTEPCTMYRFSAQKGDTYHNEDWGGNYPEMEFTATLADLTQTQEGLKYYVWDVTAWDGKYEKPHVGSDWIEGVGGISNPLSPLGDVYPGGTWEQVITCHVGEELIYADPQYKDLPLFPDPIVTKEGLYYLINSGEHTAKLYMDHEPSCPKEVVIPPTIAVNGEEYPVIVSPYCMAGCTNLQTVVVSEGIDNVDGMAFQDCSSLVSATIPESVTHLGVAVFMGCASLKSIYCYAPVSFGTPYFSEGVNKSEVTLYVPQHLLEDYQKVVTDIKVLPIESSGIASLHSDSALPAPTYTLDGRKASSPEAKGLHVKEGKVTLHH